MMIRSSGSIVRRERVILCKTIVKQFRYAGDERDEPSQVFWRVKQPIIDEASQTQELAGRFPKGAFHA
jgi:hypothetical protein